MAGGKALVGGTAYDITKGKTLIGGTAYDITAGKTLIGGTAYDIKFASPPPTIDTLLRDMKVVKDASRNLSTNDYVSIPTSTISSGLYYVFQFCGTATTIYKFKNGVLTFLNGYASGSGAGVALYNSSLYSGSTYDTTNFTNVTRYRTIYGGTIAAVEFPSFKEYESEIDALLGAWSPQNPNGMALDNVAGRNSSSTGYVRNNNRGTLGYYIVARFKQWGSSYTGSGEDTAGISIFYGSSSNWEMINQVTPNWAGGHLSSGYLTLGSCYGGTIALLY